MSRRISPPQRIALIIASCVLAVVLCLPWLVGPPPLAPIKAQAEVVASDVYRLMERARRIPVEVALPHLARAGLPPFVEALPLEEGSRTRILARLDAEDFVDDLVPFLLAVKGMYLPDDGGKGREFRQLASASQFRAGRGDSRHRALDVSLERRDHG